MALQEQHSPMAPQQAQHTDTSTDAGQQVQEQQEQFHLPLSPVKHGQTGQQPSCTATVEEIAAVCSKVSSALRQPSSLEAIEAQWRQLHPIVCCWLVSSLVNLMVLSMSDAATSAFLLAETAAVIGVVAAARSTIPSCRGDLDMVTLVKQLRTLGWAALLLDLLTLLITDSILLSDLYHCSESEMCSLLRVLTGFYTLILVSHALLSFLASRAARNCSRLLPTLTGVQLP